MLNTQAVRICSILSSRERPLAKQARIMGVAKERWGWVQEAGNWVGDKLGKLAGWAGGVMNKFNEPERQASMEDSKSLMNEQLGLNMIAAEHGNELQKNMIDYTSPAMQMQRYKEAGLNPALMYGMGGSSGQSVGSQTTSGVSNSGTDAGSRMMAKNQMMGMGLQLAKLKSEIDVNKSVAEANRANAGLQTEKTTTEAQSRDVLIENIRQEGISKWLDNILKDYKMSGQNWGSLRNANLDWFTSIDENAPELKMLNTAIIKTAADAGNADAQMLLNNKKAENYMYELLTARISADANKEMVAIRKLEQEFNTGETVNWKNLSEVLIKLLGTLGGLTPKGGGITINK